MKFITLQFKIILGVVLFIVLICACYSATLFNSSSSNNNYNFEVIGQVEYKGQFLMPVELFQVVTSKYGARIHPISRKEFISYRDRFSWKQRK